MFLFIKTIYLLIMEKFIAINTFRVRRTTLSFTFLIRSRFQWYRCKSGFAWRVTLNYAYSPFNLNILEQSGLSWLRSICVNWMMMSPRKRVRMRAEMTLKTPGIRQQSVLRINPRDLFSVYRIDHIHRYFIILGYS